MYRGGDRPLMMYTLPELYNAEDRLCHVPHEDIAVCEEETLPKANIPCDETVKELCTILMTENNLKLPTDAKEAVELYKQLRDNILSIL